MTTKKKETPASIEARALSKMNGGPVEADPDAALDWNIIPGRPLPDGFVNTPCGDPDHFCVDKAGNFNPEWFQLFIEQRDDHQKNPQTFRFPGYGAFAVPLNTWVDAPLPILESLRSAVETHHVGQVAPGLVVLGQIDANGHEVHPNVPRYERRRFSYEYLMSAKVEA